jgi:hypothetical protein
LRLVHACYLARAQRKRPPRCTGQPLSRLSRLKSSSALTLIRLEPNLPHHGGDAMAEQSHGAKVHTQRRRTTHGRKNRAASPKLARGASDSVVSNSKDNHASRIRSEGAELAAGPWSGGPQNSANAKSLTTPQRSGQCEIKSEPLVQHLKKTSGTEVRLSSRPGWRIKEPLSDLGQEIPSGPASLRPAGLG